MYMKQVKQLFKDNKLEEDFKQNGFLKIPLLDDAQVSELVALFDKTQVEHKTLNSLHHTTTSTKKPELILKVDSLVKKIFVPELEKVLIDFKPLAACFHIKESGVGSATGMHQDPTFVNEEEYCSANVWVALHDMNEQNGNLYFIPGSNHVKCLRITPNSPNYYQPFYDALPAMAVAVPMKKGEAVIFNNATIHGATDNRSEQLRLAATLLVCSKPADWLIYYREKDSINNKIEKYELDLNAFISMAENEGRPNRNTIKELVSYDFPEITKEEFLEITGTGKTKATYFQRMKNVFKSRSLV